MPYAKAIHELAAFNQEHTCNVTDTGAVKRIDHLQWQASIACKAFINALVILNSGEEYALA